MDGLLRIFCLKRSPQAFEEWCSTWFSPLGLIKWSVCVVCLSFSLSVHPLYICFLSSFPLHVYAVSASANSSLFIIVSLLSLLKADRFHHRQTRYENQRDPPGIRCSDQNWQSAGQHQRPARHHHRLPHQHQPGSVSHHVLVSTSILASVVEPKLQSSVQLSALPLSLYANPGSMSHLTRS